MWSDLTASLLIGKYNAGGMEWSLLEPVTRGSETVVCFGGAGSRKQGHPEGAARLEPGESFHFGETRLQVVDGDWKQAYYAYRSWMESKGCRTPPGYDPPVHWNELYDNAYSIPLYLHVNLKQDNEHALMFWWYASTCWHLGAGGRSSPRVWEAQKEAMKTYLANKQFYTQGAFYGLDGTVHAHTLPDVQESVIDVFNLEDRPIRKTIRFRPADIGLLRGAVEIAGTSFTSDGEDVSVELSLLARDHRLLKVRHTPGAALPHTARAGCVGEYGRY